MAMTLGCAALSLFLLAPQQYTRDAFINAKSATNVVAQVLVVDASTSGALADRYTFSVVDNKPVAPSVAGLLDVRSPSAIAGLVVSVSVDSVQRMFRRRAPAHVSEEPGKTAEPFGAHTDATSAVRVEFDVVRIVAAVFHRCPRLVLLRFGHAVPLSFSAHRQIADATACAPAALSGCQVTRVDDLLDTALATAQPLCRQSGCEANRSKSPVFEPCSVYQLTHGAINFTTRYSAKSPKEFA